MHHPTPSAHMGQSAPQPLRDCFQLQPMGTELLAVTRQQVSRYRLNGRPRDRQRGLACALQRSPAMTQVGHLAVGLPQKTFFHFPGQAAVRWQVLLLQQLHGPISLPGHVRGDKLRNQFIARHVEHRAGLLELLLDPFQERRPSHTRFTQLIHHVRQGRANVVQVGACSKKTRPVCRILNRVRERNQLLVVVKDAGPAALHHLRTERRISSTQEQQFVLFTAGWARIVVPCVLGLANHLRALSRHAKHPQQLLMTASLAFALPLLNRSTSHTNAFVDTLDMRTRDALRRIEACGFRAPREPGVVDLVQLCRELAGSLHQSRQPSRCAALTALDHGQIHTVALTRQVPLAAQLHVQRVRAQLAHHTTQLAHPKLHPQRHQGLIALTQCPSHQNQQCIQHLHHLRGAGRWHVAREGFCQL